ncbi:MAG: hypothetical protein Satyrvirus1_42 [Satyrvirus sp.]|uniref:Uncharacterized protein n=1 Tax=Satyrvirus sp. TaxID=2487771 RepID=A0A3G5ACM0_9VIRU|nr:MAG: hypothetical protein Satyrvirus1_42 [Satyrvirus sp.]
MEQTNKPIFANLQNISTTELKNLKIGFFIDILSIALCRSRGGFNDTILDAVKKFIKNIAPKLNYSPKFVVWSSISYDIGQIDNIDLISYTHYFDSIDEIDPSCIFTNSRTLQLINNIDVAIIISSSEIGIPKMYQLAIHATKYGKHLKGIIGVIVKQNEKMLNSMHYDIYQNISAQNPSETNVSILFPAMVSDSCILHYDSENIHVLWSCGSFKVGWNSVDITDGMDWSQATILNFDKICSILIPIYNEKDQLALLDEGYINFGSGLYFSPNHLLESNPPIEKIIEFPFDRICQYFKTNLLFGSLTNWFKYQYQIFIKNCFNNDDSDLIGSFIKNRNNLIIKRYINDNEIEVENYFEIDKKIYLQIKILKILMNILERDDRTETCMASSISAAKYKIKIFDDMHREKINFTASFREPFKWLEQFYSLCETNKLKKYECSVCHEISVPFIIVRKIFDKDNISDIIHKTNTYYYSEIVCEKCADYFCYRKVDPTGVECVASLPIIDLDNDNTKNIYLDCFAKLTNSNSNSNSNLFDENKNETQSKFKHIFSAVYNFSTRIISSILYPLYNMAKNSNTNELEKVKFLMLTFTKSLHNRFDFNPEFQEILVSFNNNLSQIQKIEK